jgi:hypothetical protein
VRVCSLYGAGFWYIPGTDTCIKIGTFARIGYAYGTSGAGTVIGTPNGLQSDGTNFNSTNTVGGRYTRMETDMFGETAGFGLSFDARTQTEYGTLRSFVDIGSSIQDTANGGGTSFTGGAGLTFDRAFLQFAGFTAGRIRSFFDVVAPGPFGLSANRVSGDTAGAGILGIGYTLPLGGGFSFSVSAEDPGYAQGGRVRSDVNISILAQGAAGGGTNNIGQIPGAGGYPPFTLGSITVDNRSMQFPDFVGALRLDGSWGFAQVAAAVHDNSAGYYANPSIQPCSGGTINPVNACGSGPLNINGGLGAGSQTNGYPPDHFGWATIAGFTLVNAFGMAGDTLAAQGVYTSGAAGYATKANGPWLIYGQNNNLGVGWVADGTFANGIGGVGGTPAQPGTSVHNTTVWSTYGVYEHLWTPKWRTSLYGGYVGVDYDSTVKNWMCNPAFQYNSTTGLVQNTAATGPTFTPLGFTGYNNAGGTAATKTTIGYATTTINGVSNVVINNQSPQLANFSSSTATPASPVFFQVQGANAHINCNPDFSWAQLGTRTLWNPVPDVDLGVEFAWVHLNTAFAGSAASVGMSNNRPSGFYNFVNQDVFSVMFRFQRSFLY